MIFAARYGGDEFLIVLTETDYTGASYFAERLRSLISENEFKSDNHSKRLSISVGFAITDAEDSDVTARELVRYADRSLYKAKDEGRNRVYALDLAKSKDGVENHDHRLINLKK